jgi:glycosyltransferase involved in cell wall biosynthesis
MNILMLTQLFQPEPNHLKGLYLAKDLIGRGHGVEVLTGFPNYPGGRVYKGYRQKWRMREMIDVVPVIRVPLFTDHSSSALRRMLCYFSLAFTACVPGILLVKKPDVVHVYQGPATLVLPAILMKVFFGVPYVLDVQDLWPESVLGSGMLRFKFFDSILHFWCDLTYRFATQIVVLSPGYKQAITLRGVPENKIKVIYNWCDVSQEITTDNQEYSDPFDLNGRFNVIYAGNFGGVQALESVIRAAAMLKLELPDVRFVFVGDGVDGDRLKKIVDVENIDNVRFIPRQPVERIRTILDKSDVLIIHLRNDPLCRIGIPQKTQAYLAAGKPIIMAVNGDAADLLNKAKAGVTCEQENPVSIADAVRKLYRMCPEERAVMALNGRRFYAENLCYSVGSSKLEKILLTVAGG